MQKMNRLPLFILDGASLNEMHRFIERLQNNGAVAVDEDALCQHLIQRAAEHIFLYVAPGAHHILGGIGVIDVDHVPA